MPSNAPPDAAPDSSPRRNSGRALIALAAIVAVGAFLRFYELDRQCLWLDEAVTVNSARLIHKDGVAVVATRDNVAPLSSWILSAIAPPGRETGAIVRLPAALAGVVAIVLIYALGVVLLDSAAVGLAAAAVAALSPFAVWYAQDGRMYSMLLMFSALCVLCFWPIANGTYKARHLAALTLATALGIYTHQYIVLTSAACGLFLLLHAGWRHKRLWIWLGTQALAALCFVPWLVFAPRREGMMAGSSKGEALFWLPYTFMAQVFGFSYGPSVNELRQRLSLEKLRPDLPWLLPALAGAAAVALAGLIWLVRSKKAGGRFCAVWLFVPTLLAMAAPLLTGRINYNVRYVIGVFPALALVLGAGLLQARRSKLLAVAAGLMLTGMILSLVNWYTSDRYAKEEIRAAVAILKREMEPGDLLVLSSLTSDEPLAVYGLPVPEGSVRVDSASRGPRSHNSLEHALEVLERELPKRRVWLLEYRVWESDPKGRLRAWLNERAKEDLKGQWPGAGLWVYKST